LSVLALLSDGYSFHVATKFKLYQTFETALPVKILLVILSNKH
jgi:hypothetical protein